MNESAVRALLSPWPGVEAGIKWEDNLVFTVAGKMFCVVCVRGPKAGSLGFKVEDERFLELTERPGFEPAPYLARAHWVSLAQPEVIAAGELQAFLRRSYELVRARLTRKLQRELAD